MDPPEAPQPALGWDKTGCWRLLLAGVALPPYALLWLLVVTGGLAGMSAHMTGLSPPKSHVLCVVLLNALVVVPTLLRRPLWMTLVAIVPASIDAFFLVAALRAGVEPEAGYLKVVWAATGRHHRLLFWGSGLLHGVTVFLLVVGTRKGILPTPDPAPQ